MTKILVVAPSWIGDTILAQPLLARLHEKHEGLSIDVLASAWGAPLLARMAEVRHVVDSPFAHGEFLLAKRWQLAQRLRREAYDEVIVLPNSWKAALSPFLAGIPKRTGYQGESRFGLINNMHRLDKKRHPRLADRYVRLADDAGEHGHFSLRRPHLQSSAAQQRAAREALDLPLDGNPIVFCPGAEYGPAKRWPARHFATLASAVGHVDNPVWLVGAPKDAHLGEKIEQACHGSALNLCGRTTLEQAIDIIASASQVVCNDSGLMHVAAALDRPLVAVFGSSSFNYTPPMSPLAKIVSLELECSPCFMRECPKGHLRCLNDLAPERVLTAMRGEKCHMPKVIYTSPQDVENAFYEALERADLDAMMAVWSEDEEIVCVHPGGPRFTDYAEIREAWRQIFSGGARLRVSLSTPSIVMTPFTAVHSLLEEISVAGDDSAHAPVVVTNVYVRGPLGWRMVLHHASPAPPTTLETPKILH